MTRAHLRLGLRPADHTRDAVKIGPVLTDAVPTHPVTADNASKVAAWGMLGNDRYGDCGPCGLEHQRMQITTYLTPTPYVATETDTLAFYKLCDPGFNATTDAGDDGVNLQDMLGVATRHGVGGVKPLGFAKVDHTNLSEIRAAIAIFGSVLFGVDLDVAQQNQTVWDYEPSDEWGGHCVLAVQYGGRAAGIGVVSWGEVIATTEAFLQHQLSEAWVVIWPEHVSSPVAQFLAGVDVAALAADYKAVTGRDFPVPVQPGPVPAPVPAPGPVPPVDPDVALAAVLRADGWLTTRHSGDNARVAFAARTWLASKGL